jgi:hypothetical protein
MRRKEVHDGRDAPGWRQAEFSATGLVRAFTVVILKAPQRSQLGSQVKIAAMAGGDKPRCYISITWDATAGRPGRPPHETISEVAPPRDS